MKYIISVLLLSCFLGFTGFEIIARIKDYDLKAIELTLFYDCVNSDFQRASNDPGLLYESTPNSYEVFKDDAQPFETAYRDRESRINSFGFRDNKEREKAKPDGIFRIVAMGGSNTYGQRVNTKDTYPAYLERSLNNKMPGKFEVWNAGVMGYVTSQKVAWAEKIVKEYEPDMFIFQIKNPGRRRSPCSGEVIHFFKDNKDLLRENIPLLYTDNPLILKLHYFLVSYSAAYRYVISKINNNILIELTGGEYFGNFQMFYKDYPFMKRYHKYGDDRSMAMLQNFIEKYNDLPILLFFHNDESKEESIATYQKLLENKNISTHIMSNTKSGELDYYSIEPPSYAYKWYAEELKPIILDIFINK